MITLDNDPFCTLFYRRSANLSISNCDISGFWCNVFLTTKYSEGGWLLKNKVASFKSFLTESEDHAHAHLVDEDPSYFDRVFPYAIAFGLDEEFTNKFSNGMLMHPFGFLTTIKNRIVSQPLFRILRCNLQESE